MNKQEINQLKDAVLHFWFEELTPEQHFKKDEDVDETIRQRFGKLHEHAVQGECYTWRDTIEGRLAEIIVLDQFSRNMFRNSPRAFQYDPMALVLSQEAVHLGLAHELPPHKRSFLYMPFMHSESLAIHEEAMKLFSEPGLEMNLDYEIQHKQIIERFGRYPHRNEVLNRSSTKEEEAFLKEPGSSF